MKILITGSSGLIGQALTMALRRQGDDVLEFDLRKSSKQDIRNPDAVSAALNGASGVIHLAAVSRVVSAQGDPELCKSVNELAFQQLLDRCASASRPPWLIFSSSREVYGRQEKLPVCETALLQPMNIYARSKCYGENLVFRTRDKLLAANIVRLSNVYGTINDHADRVIPAFARTSVLGGSVLVEGGERCLDFVHVDDVVRGLLVLIELTARGNNLVPIHLASGVGTKLNDLAHLALVHARKPVTLINSGPRACDIYSFVGDTCRARKILGWQNQITIDAGFARLVNDFEHSVAADLTRSGLTERIAAHASS